MIPVGPVVAKGQMSAKRETVWAYLVRADLRAAWWPELVLDARFGGAVSERWSEGEGSNAVSRDAQGSVDVVVEGHALGFRWKEAGDARATAVLITLRSMDEATAVTVSETGFDTLSEPAARAAASQEGWRVLLGDLAAAAEASGDVLPEPPEPVEEDPVADAPTGSDADPAADLDPDTDTDAGTDAAEAEDQGAAQPASPEAGDEPEVEKDPEAGNDSEPQGEPHPAGAGAGADADASFRDDVVEAEVVAPEGVDASSADTEEVHTEEVDAEETGTQETGSEVSDAEASDAEVSDAEVIDGEIIEEETPTETVKSDVDDAAGAEADRAKVEPEADGAGTDDTVEVPDAAGDADGDEDGSGESDNLDEPWRALGIDTDDETDDGPDFDSLIRSR